MAIPRRRSPTTVSDATVESDLEALGDIGSGNVVVTTALGGGWEIRFTGTLAGTYENQLTGNGTDLDGTLTGIAIDTISLGGDAGNVSDTVDPDGIDDDDYYNPLGEVVQDDPGLHQRRHHRRFQQDHRLHLQLRRRNQPHGRDRQRPRRDDRMGLWRDHGHRQRHRLQRHRGRDLPAQPEHRRARLLAGDDGDGRCAGRDHHQHRPELDRADLCLRCAGPAGGR